ncbi:MAG: hypothetical protein LBU35_00220 [Holosporales bacterium]|nr:hypothetical protein [Holosporales bacterium]
MVIKNYTISALKICQGPLALLALHLDKSDCYKTDNRVHCGNFDKKR